MRIFGLLTLMVFFLTASLSAQVYSNKEVGKKNQVLADSLKTTEYPYSLPIWGKQATQKGFSLPYSAGVGINYMWQESDLIIDNLFVGFNNGPQYNLDDIVRFNNAVATANGVNIRPDIWLFPFLNVYGIFSKAKTSTAIDAGFWLPNTDNEWSEIMTFSTKANFDVTTAGFGLTPTIGVGGGWFALDMNMTWSDVSALDKPAFAFIFGPRFGKTFNLKKKDSNIAFWAGAFRLHLKSGTNGSLNFNELFDIPAEELQAKIDQGQVKVDQAQTQVDDWWAGLSTIDQNRPGNIARYEAYNKVISKTDEVLGLMEGALNDDNMASVQYSLEKRPKDMWNFLVGTQYQLNKHFMIRGEFGFLGSRQQFIGGLQYRFGL